MMIRKKSILNRLMMIAAFLFTANAFAVAQASEALVKNITVKGSVQFVSPQGTNMVTLYKVRMSGDKQAVDSVQVTEQNKSFTFNLKQDHPGVYTIDAFHWDQADFWSDADVTVNMRGYDTAKIHMKIPVYNYVEGSMDNNFINFAVQIGDLYYLKMVDEYNEQYYADQYKKTDSAWATYLSTRPRYDTLIKDYRQRMDVLLKAYKDRPVILYNLRGMTGADNKDEYDKALGMLDNLINKYPWLTEAKEAKETIIGNRKQAEKLANGQPVPSVSYPDADGKLHGLEKYKGSYLLIDFWASWCGPCRAAIPKVKDLYSQYHAKGFNVVSISIDTDKNAWLKAMKEENMPWQQLLSSDKDETMKQFQFSGIPTMYLIDPAGNIIDKYLGYSPEAEAAIKAAIANKVTAPAVKKSIPAIGF